MLVLVLLLLLLLLLLSLVPIYQVHHFLQYFLPSKCLSYRCNRCGDGVVVAVAGVIDDGAAITILVVAGDLTDIIDIDIVDIIIDIIFVTIAAVLIFIVVIIAYVVWIGFLCFLILEVFFVSILPLFPGSARAFTSIFIVISSIRNIFYINAVVMIALPLLLLLAVQLLL